MNTSAAATFAAFFVALYAAHHVGDYWVQTDHQARNKGLPGWTGRVACFAHVAGYVLTQLVFLAVVDVAFGLGDPGLDMRTPVALVVSGTTHYLADRRKPLEWLASLFPGKANFYRLGRGSGTLGTGAWALDQSFHIAFSVFVPALILAM